MKTYNFGENLYQWSKRAEDSRFWIYCKFKETPKYMKEYFEKDNDSNGIMKVLKVDTYYRRDDCDVKVLTDSGRQFTFLESELEFIQ